MTYDDLDKDELVDTIIELTEENQQLRKQLSEKIGELPHRCPRCNTTLRMSGLPLMGTVGENGVVHWNSEVNNAHQ